MFVVSTKFTDKTTAPLLVFFIVAVYPFTGLVLDEDAAVQLATILVLFGVKTNAVGAFGAPTVVIVTVADLLPSPAVPYVLTAKL